MKPSQWQPATGKRHTTRAAAGAHVAMLRKANPRREFRVSLVTGPRGGQFYQVDYKITQRERDTFVGD